MSDLVQLERRGAVAVLTLSRPEALNALNEALLLALDTRLEELHGDETLRAVVLTGAGKAFVAGADISAMRTMDPVEAQAFAAFGQRVGVKLAQLTVPVIAAVNGYALGGGCELAMCCDLILAGQRAVFGQPEVNLGVIPGFGGTQRLARLVGRQRAMELCVTGRLVKADEAVRIGLALDVVEGDVVDAAVAMGETIAQKGPFAVHLVKRAIHENVDGPLEAGLAAERSLFGLCFATDDQTEGMAAFLEKRAAEFTGR